MWACAWRVAEAAPAHTREGRPWRGHPLTRGIEGTLRVCRAAGGNETSLAVGEARDRLLKGRRHRRLGGANGRRDRRRHKKQ